MKRSRGLVWTMVPSSTASLPSGTGVVIVRSRNAGPLGATTAALNSEVLPAASVAVAVTMLGAAAGMFTPKVAVPALFVVTDVVETCWAPSPKPDGSDGYEM